MMRIEPVDSKFAPRKKFAIGNKAGRAATQQLTDHGKEQKEHSAFASEIVLLTASMWISINICCTGIFSNSDLQNVATV